MAIMIEYSEVFLDFLIKHPGVTIVLENARFEEYGFVIGLHSTRNGNFKKHSFLFNPSPVENLRDRLQNDLEMCYREVTRS